MRVCQFRHFGIRATRQAERVASRRTTFLLKQRRGETSIHDVLRLRRISRMSRLILAASRAPVSIMPAQRLEVSSNCD